MKRKNNEMAQPNYLLFVPQAAEGLPTTVDEEGQVVILMENKGLFNRIAQKLFKKPKVSQIHLESYGSYVWNHMDGNRTVYEIGELLKEEFGETVEPLYPRLIRYMDTLRAYGFVRFVEEKENS